MPRLERSSSRRSSTAAAAAPSGTPSSATSKPVNTKSKPPGEDAMKSKNSAQEQEPNSEPNSIALGRSESLVHSTRKDRKKRPVSQVDIFGAQWDVRYGESEFVAIHNDESDEEPFWLGRLHVDVLAGDDSTNEVEVSWYETATEDCKRFVPTGGEDFIPIGSIICAVTEFVTENFQTGEVVLSPKAPETVRTTLQRQLEDGYDSVAEARRESEQAQKRMRAMSQKTRRRGAVVDDSSDDDNKSRRKTTRKKSSGGGRTTQKKEKVLKPPKKRKGKLLAPRPDIETMIDIFHVEQDKPNKPIKFGGDSERASKEVIRAVVTNNTKLFSALAKDYTGILSLHVPRSTSVWKSPLHYALEMYMQPDNDNGTATQPSSRKQQKSTQKLNGMLEALLKDLFLQSKQPNSGGDCNSIKRGESNEITLTQLSSGSHTSRYSSYNRRKVNATRGGREGNNAFRKTISDSTNTYKISAFQSGPSLESPTYCNTTELACEIIRTMCSSCDQVDVQKFTALELFLTDVDKTDPGFMLQVYSRMLQKFVEYGHLAVARYVFESMAERHMGINSLHVKALQQDFVPESGKIRASSAIKRTSDGVRLCPAHCAAINPDPRFIQEIIAANPDAVTMKDSNGATILHYAAASASPNVLVMLLTKYPDSLSRAVLDSDSRAVSMPLTWACRAGRAENVKILLDHRPTCEKYPSLEIPIAAFPSTQNNARDDGSDSDSSASGMDKSNKQGEDEEGQQDIEEEDPVAYAISRRSNLIKTMLEHKVYNWSPLHVAVRCQRTTCFDTVRALLDCGADPNAPAPPERNKQTAIHLAACLGKLDVLKMLVEEFDGNLGAVDKLDRTCAILAAMNGHVDVLAYCLQRGVDPDAVDSSENTAAHYASAYGWLACLKLLMKSAHAKVDEKNNWGTTPLTLALQLGRMSCASLLLDSNQVDVNFKDNEGRTLLQRLLISYLERLESRVKEGEVQSPIQSDFPWALAKVVELPTVDVTTADAAGDTLLHIIARCKLPFGSPGNASCTSVANLGEKMSTVVLELFNYFVSRGCDINVINQCKQSPVVCALEAKNYSLVEHLIQNKAELGNCWVNGGNVLHELIQQAFQVTSQKHAGDDAAYCIDLFSKVQRVSSSHNNTVHDEASDSDDDDDASAASDKSSSSDDSEEDGSSSSDSSSSSLPSSRKSLQQRNVIHKKTTPAAHQKGTKPSQTLKKAKVFLDMIHSLRTNQRSTYDRLGKELHKNSSLTPPFLAVSLLPDVVHATLLQPTTAQGRNKSACDVIVSLTTTLLKDFPDQLENVVQSVPDSKKIDSIIDSSESLDISCDDKHDDEEDIVAKILETYLESIQPGSMEGNSLVHLICRIPDSLICIKLLKLLPNFVPKCAIDGNTPLSLVFAWVACESNMVTNSLTANKVVQHVGELIELLCTKHGADLSTSCYHYFGEEIQVSQLEELAKQRTAKDPSSPFNFKYNTEMKAQVDLIQKQFQKLRKAQLTAEGQSVVVDVSQHDLNTDDPSVSNEMEVDQDVNGGEQSEQSCAKNSAPIETEDNILGTNDEEDVEMEDAQSSMQCEFVAKDILLEIQTQLRELKLESIRWERKLKFDPSNPTAQAVASYSNIIHLIINPIAQWNDVSLSGKLLKLFTSLNMKYESLDYTHRTVLHNALSYTTSDIPSTTLQNLIEVCQSLTAADVTCTGEQQQHKAIACIREPSDGFDIAHRVMKSTHITVDKKLELLTIIMKVADMNSISAPVTSSHQKLFEKFDGMVGETCLGLAVKCKSYRLVQFMTRTIQGVDLSIPDFENLNTPLHHAVIHVPMHEDQRVKIMKLLINKGANVNAKNTAGDSVLHKICEELDSTDELKLLLSSGVEVNAQNNAGRTPLHVAVYAKASARKDVLDEHDLLLIKAGANPNIQDRIGNTPLFSVFGFADRKLWEFPKHSQDDYDPIDDLSKLCQAGANVNVANKLGITPLHLAAVSNATVCALHLIKRSAVLDASDRDGNTPLGLSFLAGNSDLAITFVNLGANVKTTVHTVERKKVQVVLREGDDIQEEKCDAEYELQSDDEDDLAMDEEKLTVTNTSTSEVRKWVVRKTSSEKHSTLYHAIDENWMGMAYFLLDQGFDSFHALKDAIALKSFQMVNKLITRIGHIVKECVDEGTGYNVLHLLSLVDSFPDPKWSTGIASRLISEGISAKSTTLLGETALHIAARRGHLELVKLLAHVHKVSVLTRDKRNNSVIASSAIDTMPSVKLLEFLCSQLRSDQVSDILNEHFEVKRSTCDENGIKTASTKIASYLDSKLRSELKSEGIIARKFIEKLKVDELKRLEKKKERAFRNPRSKRNHHDKDPDQPKYEMVKSTLLIEAIRDSLSKARFLLDQGADPLIPDSEGKSPLWHALFGGGTYSERTQTAVCLLEAGADIDAVDVHGRSPLWYSVLLGQTDITMMLLKWGASIVQIPSKLATFESSTKCIENDLGVVHMALLRQDFDLAHLLLRSVHWWPSSKQVVSSIEPRLHFPCLFKSSPNQPCWKLAIVVAMGDDTSTLFTPTSSSTTECHKSFTELVDLNSTDSQTRSALVKTMLSVGTHTTEVVANSFIVPVDGALREAIDLWCASKCKEAGKEDEAQSTSGGYGRPRRRGMMWGGGYHSRSTYATPPTPESISKLIVSRASSILNAQGDKADEKMLTDLAALKAKVERYGFVGAENIIQNEIAPYVEVVGRKDGWEALTASNGIQAGSIVWYLNNSTKSSSKYDTDKFSLRTAKVLLVQPNGLMSLDVANGPLLHDVPRCNVLLIEPSVNDFHWIGVDECRVQVKDLMKYQLPCCGRSLLHIVVRASPVGTVVAGETVAQKLVEFGCSIDLKDKSGKRCKDILPPSGPMRSALGLVDLDDGEVVDNAVSSQHLDGTEPVDVLKDYEDAVSLFEANKKDSVGEIEAPSISNVCEITSKGLRVLSSKDNNGETFYYDATLTKADVASGMMSINNFYHLQIVQDPVQSIYILITRWGRIGEDGKFQQTPHSKRESCVKEFEKVFRSKSGNAWADRKQFQAKTKKYVLLDTIKHSVHEQDNPLVRTELGTRKDGLNHATTTTPSVMNRKRMMIGPNDGEDQSEVDPVARMVRQFVARETLVSAIQSTGLDEFHQPLGKIKYSTLKQARITLFKIRDSIEALNVARADHATFTITIYREHLESIARLTNEYYQLVPEVEHSGKPIEPLRTIQDVGKQLVKLDSIEDLHAAVRLRVAAWKSSHERGGVDVLPIDYCIRALPPIRVLPTSSTEYRTIMEYFYNTRGDGNNRLMINQVFAVSRPGERERMQKHVGLARKLLWHGSPTHNMVGLLSHGLKIAPPEAPTSGYAFGKGIYLADSFEKSFPYSRTQLSSSAKTRPRGYILLCEAAVGKPYRTSQTEYMEEAKQGFDSTLALGNRVPHESHDTIVSEIGPKVAVPLGYVGCPAKTKVRTWQEEDSYHSFEHSDLINEVANDPSTVFPATVDLPDVKDARQVTRRQVSLIGGPLSNAAVLRKEWKDIAEKPVDALDLKRSTSVQSENDNLSSSESEQEKVDAEDTVLDSCLIRTVAAEQRNLQHNEYVLYDESQVRIRYVVELTIQDWFKNNFTLDKYDRFVE